jgi:hypothetical protein
MSKWPKNIPPPRYRETYKGVGFHITHVGIVVMDDPFPACRDANRRSWGTFCTEQEAKVIGENDLPDDMRIAMVRKMIDRASIYFA